MKTLCARTGLQGLHACAVAAAMLLASCGASDSNASPYMVGTPQLAGTGGTLAGTGGVAAVPGTGGSGPAMIGTAGAVSTGTAGTGGMGAMTGGTGGMRMMTGGMGGMAMMTGGMGGMSGTGGMGMMTGGTGGMAGAGGTGGATGGACGSGTPTDGRPTTGPLACIVEQHNAVRAKVSTTTPLPPLTWSADLAAYAQAWTDMTCTSPKHRTNPTLNGQRLGENLYASFGSGGSANAGKQAIDGWAGEVACYTFGPFMSGDKCDMTCTSNMSSDGCGHYTQVVWRASTQIGCGVTTCGSGFMMQTEVICNYGPAGNFIGMNPY
jgi:hypothetical protein